MDCEQAFVIMYKIKPGVTGFNIYHTSEYPRYYIGSLNEAKKFDSSEKADQFLIDFPDRMELDHDHYEAIIRRVIKINDTWVHPGVIDSDGLDLKKIDRPNFAEEVEKAGIKTWDDLIQWIKILISRQQKMTQAELAKPCKQSCPVCGSKQIKRVFVVDEEKAWQLIHPNNSTAERLFWTQPEVGKVHNTCGCCEYEWNSDPLPQETDDDSN